jgi:hypothetical protein
LCPDTNCYSKKLGHSPGRASLQLFRMMCPKRPGFFNLKGHIMEITFKNKEEKKQFDDFLLEIALLIDNIDQKRFVKKIKEAEIEP